MATTNSTRRVERQRLVTRSGFDGLVCTALLKHLGMLGEILFAHPKDMQDGRILDRSSRTVVGGLMLEYGGGGRDAAGTCQVGNERAAAAHAELIARINADG